ncbi:MAG: protein kinase domain-containing protein [Candidatus Sulfotelmatobacter sp.]
MPLTPGTLLGQYEIISPLGAGSMGEVYRAHDSRLNRDVAIKVLPELISFDAGRLHRFEIEAKAAAALNHPNILAVYQMGTHDGVPYLVSELLEGRTLTETIRRAPLPYRKTIDYAVQIAHGLAAAHEKGIIHRDLKPDNIFVTREGRIKILDFGLAKLREPKDTLSNAAATVTLPGVAMGTVGYMSPEQVRGLNVDHRSDIFAFGAILYEMVMGKATFQKPTSADTISAILNEEPAPLTQLSPDTPVALERVVRRCLEKNSEQRFQSASDLAFALEALSDGATPSQTSSHAIRKEEAMPRRQPLTWLLGSVILLIAAAALLYFWMQPAAVPRVANYLQLTHDGAQKSLIGTDGARLYLGLGAGAAGSSGSFVAHGVAEMSVSGGEPKKISILSSPDMVPVDLSPDGSELLVVDGKGVPPVGSLWSLPILGGSPRRLADAIGETGAWSRDGKMLAYTNLGELFVAKTDGTESRKLLTASGDIKNITWSPDGDQLRFDTTESVGSLGQQLVWEVNADGTKLHRLLPGWHNPADECCGRYTADGKYFVFQSQGQLWALAQKSRWLHSKVQPIQLTSSPLTLSSPLPSKDGKKLFLIGQGYRGELTRYDGKTHQFFPFLAGISAEYVDFFRDGQWVAYVSYPEGTLWRSKLDGSQRQQLTDPPLYAVLPRWSPDGKKIVFFEFGNAGKAARMYEVSPDGGNPSLLLPNDPGQQFDPNFSPDGSKLVFSGESNDPSSAIRILDLTTHQVTTLPDSQGYFSPRWSRNGRYVTAFSADSERLLLFDFQSQKWTQLATGSFGWLNWSKDGEYVYVLDFRGKGAVLRIRISDHKAEAVVDLKNFVVTGRYGGALALAPDDSPLLLRDTGTQDVYSLDWESP